MFILNPLPKQSTHLNNNKKNFIFKLIVFFFKIIFQFSEYKCTYSYWFCLAPGMKISSSTFPSSSPDGSDCDMEFAVVMLNCWSRRQRSLYSRNSLGYSPSKACFRCMEAIHNNKNRELKNQFQHHTISKYIVLYISTKAMKKKLTF